MKKFCWIGLGIFLLNHTLLPIDSARGEEGRKNTRRGTVKPVFPAYPNRPGVAPRPGVARPGPAVRPGMAVRPHVPSRPDSLGNHVTDDHMKRVDFARNREEIMKRDVHVTDAVRLGRAHFANGYRHEFEHKQVFIDTYLHHYNTIVLEHRPIVALWNRHLFFGGFYYGFHPVLDIDAYFYNPLVYWFYVGAANDAYYRTWYAADYDAHPELHRPFAYPGLYYPTENLRQMLFGVSAMPIDKQIRFREAMGLFTQRIAQNLANATGQHVLLSKGDITVTHYEVVGYDDAIVLEGFVNFNGNSHDFKGMLDLENPAQTTVIAPISLDVAPTPPQVQTLDALNARIAEMKGEPAPVQASPNVTEAPVEAEPATGQISADPASAGAAPAAPSGN